MVAVIVNSFNRAGLLRGALDSLWSILPQWKRKWVVVVFDAGSTDGSRELVRAAQMEDIAAKAGGTLLLVEAQPGDDGSFSAGINAAARAAIARFPEVQWLVLFETDNWAASFRPFEQAIGILQDHAELAAAGFTVRKHSGVPAGLGCAFPTCMEFIAGLHLMGFMGVGSAKLHWSSSGDESGPGSTQWSYYDVIYTSPIVIRRDAWVASEGLDALVFPFSDCDVDWAWRLRNMKLRQAVLQTDEVVHDNREEASTWSMKRMLHFHRARFQLLRRHRGMRVHLIKPLLFLRHLAEVILVCLTKRKSPKYRELLRQKVLLLQTCAKGYSGLPI